MQSRVVNHCRISSENRRLYGWMPRVRETPAERDLNNVFEVELNFVGFQRVREPIERLLQPFFKLFETRHNFFDGRLIDHTARPIDEETNVVVKVDVRTKFHHSLSVNPSV